MGKIRGKNTGPELALRRAVWAHGVRFRCHPKSVAGRPDIALSKARLAVFVDGCFWHGCPKHFRVPKTRARFWSEKIARNGERRRTVVRELAGWTVLEFFECELRENLPHCAKQVAHAAAGRGSTR